jgi:hypothetical protein
MFRMTLNDWAWIVIVLVLGMQILFEKQRGCEQDAAIGRLQGEVRFLDSRLNDRPSTFEVLLYIDDAFEKRKKGGSQ